MKEAIIQEFEGRYKVREDGQVIVVDTGEFKIQGTDTKGYKTISVTYLGKRKKLSVHRLIAKAFLPYENDRQQVNHKDGIKTNNHVSNLEWCSINENLEHAFQNNLIHLSKLSREEVEDLLTATDLFTNEMSIKYGVGKDTVRRILEKPGLTYRHFKNKN